MEPNAPEAFEAFARRQIPSLLRSARLLAGGPAAEDLVQDTLARLAQRWPRVSTMANPDGYAYRTLVNQFLSDQRHARVAAAARILGREVTATTGQERVDDLDVLRWALAHLPARQRAAIVLKHYLDLDTGEVAALMRIRESTVRSLIARGTATLQTQLGQLEGDPDGNLSRRP